MDMKTHTRGELVIEDVSGDTYILQHDEPRQRELFGETHSPSPKKRARDVSTERARRQRILDAVQDSAKHRTRPRHR